MTENGYSLSQLAEMTMLTERTLHNYLKRGLLHGEKTASGWRFPEEEVARFWAQPFVNAAVNSKQLAVAEDFLQRRVPTAGQICMVYDYAASAEEASRLCEYFLSAVKQCSDLCFTYHYEKGLMRVTLRGKAEEVTAVINGALPPNTSSFPPMPASGGH